MESHQTNPWQTMTLKAFEHAQAGRTADAAACWLSAATQTECLPSDDPRRASALHNNAVGLIVRDEAARADVVLAQAEAAWRRSGQWLDALVVPSHGGSTAFHFLLETSNEKAFQHLRRQKYRDLWIAAGGATTALRQRLRSPLPSHDCAERFDLAHASSGGDGDDVAYVRAQAEEMQSAASSLIERWVKARNAAPAIVHPLIDAVHLLANPKHITVGASSR